MSSVTYTNFCYSAAEAQSRFITKVPETFAAIFLVTSFPIGAINSIKQELRSFQKLREASLVFYSSTPVPTRPYKVLPSSLPLQREFNFHSTTYQLATTQQVHCNQQLQDLRSNLEHSCPNFCSPVSCTLNVQ